MNIRFKDLGKTLIGNLNCYDGKILKVKNENNNIIITFLDGCNDNQINELLFVNCNKKFKYKLEDREIYQLDDLVHFERSNWSMSFLIWMNEGDCELLEKVQLGADNIITKTYINGDLEKEEDLNKVFM